MLDKVWKKWIAVLSMVLVGAANITSPINLASYLPEQLTSPIVSNISIVGLASFLLLISAWWVFNRETD